MPNKWFAVNLYKHIYVYTCKWNVYYYYTSYEFTYILHIYIYKWHFFFLRKFLLYHNTWLSLDKNLIYYTQFIHIYLVKCYIHVVDMQNRMGIKLQKKSYANYLPNSRQLEFRTEIRAWEYKTTSPLCLFFFFCAWCVKSLKKTLQNYDFFSIWLRFN